MSALRRSRAALAACALWAASGCVYYNGMYNAERAASEAERFERQGRTAEARDRWQRAIVHAESVAVRHPRSRWAADAQLLRGRGLVRLERFNDGDRLERALLRGLVLQVDQHPGQDGPQDDDNADKNDGGGVFFHLLYT